MATLACAGALSADLAQRGHDSSPVGGRWHCIGDGWRPALLEGKLAPRVQVLAMVVQASVLTPDAPLARADVWIEAFGCEIPAEFVGHFAQSTVSITERRHSGKAARPVWIDLEYLVAETYVERSPRPRPRPSCRARPQGWAQALFSTPVLRRARAACCASSRRLATPLG